jgi:hypothetical protein
VRYGTQRVPNYIFARGGDLSRAKRDKAMFAGGSCGFEPCHEAYQGHGSKRARPRFTQGDQEKKGVSGRSYCGGTGWARVAYEA